ncbi:hypothetical protein HOD29_05395 [archaeon]|jgi:deoxycytidylate deaminase|nr:hypothetical protein [archaeon]
MLDDKKYMKMAYVYAKKHSDDPRTNTGAVLVREAGKVLSYGSNSIPYGVNKLDFMLERNVKADYLGHAEKKSIAFCARKGYSTEDSILYTPWEPCGPCGIDIINAGIREIVLHKDINDFDRELSDGVWFDGQRIALENLKQAGVNVRYIEGKLFDEDFTIKFRGQDFSP